MISARGDKINPLDVAMKQADIVAERLKLDRGLWRRSNRPEERSLSIFLSRWMMEAPKFSQDIESNTI